MRTAVRVPLRIAPLCLSLLIGWNADIAAAATCTSFNLGTNGTLTLTDDYVQTTSSSCLVISGTNATVDLNGHTIDQSYGSGAGIECTSGGITVMDSTATPGGVSGAFLQGIKNCAKVHNVRIFESTHSVPTYAVSNSSTFPLASLTDTSVDVVGPAPEGGLAFHGPLKDRESRIANNYFQVLVSGINVTDMVSEAGSGKARIENNVVSGGTYGQIVVTGTTQVNVENNLLTDRDSGSDCTDLATGVSYSRLYCDCTECDSDDPTYDFPDYAVTDSCPGTLPLNAYDANSTYTLTSSLDLNASSGSCITVAHAGRKVDLNGHTVTNSSAGGAGITFTASGGSVLDSGTPKGGIGGNFATAVVDAETITSIRIGNGPDVGVSASTSRPLKSLTGNTIDADVTAASVYLKDRPNSEVRDNYLRGGNEGLDILGIVNTSGTAKAPIEQNVIRDSHEYAIQTNTSHLTVRDNLMYRRDASAISPTASHCLSFLVSPGTVNDLMCDCPSTEADYCEGDVPPMSIARF